MTCLTRQAQAQEPPCPSQEQITTALPQQCPLHDGAPTLCPSAEQITTRPRAKAPNEGSLPLQGNVDVDAERVIGNLQEDTLVFQGSVSVRQGAREVKGEQIEYSKKANSVKTESPIEYTDPLVHVTGSNGGSYSPAQGGDFKGGQFELRERPGRGKADSIWWTPQGVLRMEGVSFTTCPLSDETWKINARSVRLDTQSKIGSAKDATIDIRGVPVLWLPSFSFPLSNERKSGFLFPVVGETSQSGALISTPFYWNIAPNLDFTLEPTWYSRRNEDIGGDFRFLTESSRGELSWNYLPNDVLYESIYTGGASSPRSRVTFTDVTELPGNLRLSLRGENVSDDHFFEDFSQGPEGTATAFLDRVALLSYRDEHWRIDAEAEQFQTVDSSLQRELRPYQRMPRVAVNGDFGWGPEDLVSYGFDSEAVRFDRNTSALTAFPVQLPGQAPYPCAGLTDARGVRTGPGCLVTGWRFMVTPRAQLNIDGPGYFIHPALAYSATQYELSNSVITSDPLTATSNGRGRYSPLRTLPIASLDTGLVLERATGSSGQRTLTLEPRLMYLYVPYRNQDNLPLFDTARPDLNPIQLFRTNRYVGGDRIGDARQLTVGLTSRLLDGTDGRQYLSATIGQAYYFSAPRVTLPGESLCSSSSLPLVPVDSLATSCTLNSRSDLVAQLQLTAFQHWSADFGMQWDPHLRRAVRQYVNVQYKPASTAVVNLSYRYELNAVDQVEVSTAWPVTRRWNLFLREIYSLRSETVQVQNGSMLSTRVIPPKSLETFAGIEYRACCWGVRLGARQFVSTFNQNVGASRDSSGVFLEVELMGFASVGSASDTVLMENIRGYVPPNARVPQSFVPPAFP